MRETVRPDVLHTVVTAYAQARPRLEAQAPGGDRPRVFEVTDNGTPNPTSDRRIILRSPGAASR